MCQARLQVDGKDVACPLCKSLRLVRTGCKACDTPQHTSALQQLSA